MTTTEVELNKVAGARSGLVLESRLFSCRGVVVATVSHCSGLDEQLSSGDVLLAVNGHEVDRMSVHELLLTIARAPHPRVLSFVRHESAFASPGPDSALKFEHFYSTTQRRRPALERVSQWVRVEHKISDLTG